MVSPSTQSLLSTTVAASQRISSPISKLNYDELVLIFMANTRYSNGFTPDHNEAGIRSLDTTRLTSQVCRRWREIVTNSPLIWANIIEWDLLVQNIDWRELVLKRAGETNLCVSGWVDLDNILSLGFFHVFLLDHLEHIRRVDIEFRGDHGPQELPFALSWPAPNLEHLNLSYVKNDPAFQVNNSEESSSRQEIPKMSRALFPSMESGSGLYFPFYWIPQLRSLIVPRAVSTRDLFSLLADTPLLESLILEKKRPSNLADADGALKEVVLPHLTHLEIQGSPFESCLCILERIIPAFDCVLRLTTSDAEPEDITTDDKFIASFGTVLKRYSLAYFNAKEVSHLKLCLSHNHLSIEAPNHDLPSTQSLEFLVDPSYALPLSISSSIISSLSSWKLSSITTLDMEISESTEHQSLRREFTAFASSCQNVEAISVDKVSAEVLYDLLAEHPAIFPALHTLKIKDIPHSSKNVKAHADSIVAILERRVLSAVPLTLLDCGSSNIFALTESEIEMLTEILPQSKSLSKLRGRLGSKFRKCGKGSLKPFISSWRKIKSKFCRTLI